MPRRNDTLDAEALCTKIARRLARLPASAKTPEIRAIRREYSRRIAGAGERQVLRLALCLLERHHHRGFAYELLHHHAPALRSLGARDLARLGRGIDAWWKVDTFGLYLAGPAWREGQINDARIIAWARADDRWWRRTALVCTVALNVKARGGNGDVRRTLRICRLLLDDHDDMVVKALSWALRALVSHDRRAVRAFLARYDGRLAARVKREVTHKLRTGLKHPRRRR
ncbi:MAG: DNA alkylation repair protein [Candidatus Eisenbacteria sp.]|nr:DNA alkylation repair protein [Candidatus Eisenbacteria bacterium]